MLCCALQCSVELCCVVLQLVVLCCVDLLKFHYILVSSAVLRRYSMYVALIILIASQGYKVHPNGK